MKHTLRTFEDSLESIRNNVMMMASLTERNLSNAIEGLLRRNQESCMQSIVDDEEIDELEKQIDKDGVDLMTRFQPVASDLRTVIATMRLSANLERIADQAVNIARKAKKLNAEAKYDSVHRIEPMIEKTVGMVKDSIRAFAERDLDLAMTMKARDGELDKMNAEIAELFTEEMTVRPKPIRSNLSFIFIARHLERIGDQATNIAEDAVFAMSAKDIRHTRSNAKD